jgi:hypothetical protein
LLVVLAPAAIGPEAALKPISADEVESGFVQSKARVPVLPVLLVIVKSPV